MRVAVLVEGESDREAVLALADKPRSGSPSGASTWSRWAGSPTSPGTSPSSARRRGLRLTGLYDAGEERFVRAGSSAAGSHPGRVATGWRRSGSTAATATWRTS